jgi:hypothetical protein
VEKCILRTASTGVQKIQDLFTNSLFRKKILGFGFWARIPESK